MHYTNPVKDLDKKDVETLILLAIQEDAPNGDVTSESIFSKEDLADAQLIAKTNGIFCGKRITEILLDIFNDFANYHIKILNSYEDGKSFQEKEILMELKGELPGLLRIERILLNFVQYLSGISTLTYQTVKKAKEVGAEIYILDTRKTLPGYRKLAKYAVYRGGGFNHRINLSEMAMIKDNHIAAAKSIKNAVEKIRSKHPEIPIEIEVDTVDQLEEAISTKPKVILLDNMNIQQIKHAMEKIHQICLEKKLPIPFIEISGGWKPDDLHLLKDIKNVGVSMGFLTHSAKFLDISMEIV